MGNAQTQTWIQTAHATGHSLKGYSDVAADE